MTTNEIIVDSDILIWWLRNKKDIRETVKSLLTHSEIVTTPVSVAEIWSGARPEEKADIHTAFWHFSKSNNFG